MEAVEKVGENMMALEDVKQQILEFCQEPRHKEAILTAISLPVKPYYHKKFTNRLLEDRYLQYTVPGNPRANNQQYIITKKGAIYLKSLA